MIGYYVHHHGAGHATRASQIATYLSVTGFGSMPRPSNWTGEWVELPRDDEGDQNDPSAGGVLHWAPTYDVGLRVRMGRIAAWITQNAPEVFVVDVSVEVTLLARLLGIPVVVVAMRGDRTDRPHLAAYDAASALIAPWPEHLPEKWPQSWLSKTTHVGAISRFDGLPLPEPAPRAGQPRRVMVLWGRGGDELSDTDLAAAQAGTPGWVWARPDPSQGAEGVWRSLSESDVVVTHGGQNALAEVAAARRPAVVVATERPFDEQEHTRAALERDALAVCVAGGWPTPQRWAHLLEAAIHIGGQRWQRWSPGDGARSAAEAISGVGCRGGGVSRSQTGYNRCMTDNTGSQEQQAKQEAAEDVVERVTSWQHGAPEETVAEELEKGFDAAGVEVDAPDVDKAAEQIHQTDEKPETPPVN